MEEIWRDVPGFKGLYKISNLGNCHSYHKNFKAHLNKLNTNSGYHRYALRKNGKYHYKLVHRLVILAFKGYSKLDVNHIDGDKTNNRIENLEYVTKSQNMRHAVENGLINFPKGKNHYSYGKLGKDNKDSIKINQLSLSGELIKVWDSIADIRRDLKISGGNVCMVCKGQRKSTGGYKWKYNSID